MYSMRFLVVKSEINRMKDIFFFHKGSLILREMKRLVPLLVPILFSPEKVHFKMSS